MTSAAIDKKLENKLEIYKKISKLNSKLTKISKINSKFIAILNSKINSKFSSFLSMVDELNITLISDTMIQTLCCVIYFDPSLSAPETPFCQIRQCGICQKANQKFPWFLKLLVRVYTSACRNIISCQNFGQGAKILAQKFGMEKMCQQFRRRISCQNSVPKF